MKKIFLNPETVSKPNGGYSQEIEIKGKIRHFYISGQIPENTNSEISVDFDAQCEIVWNNISETLKSGDTNFENIVKIKTYLTNPNQAIRNGEIRRKFPGTL